VIIGIDNPEFKLKPGMTANITITVDQRDNALKIPNAALRYTPPGVPREQMDGQHGQAFAITTQARRRESLSEGPEAAASPLAPGQKWNPETKIKTVPPKRTLQRPAVVYVLNALHKPEPRRVVLGITDGSATEVVSGEVQPGDLLVIGDSTQGTQPSNASKPSNAPSFLQQMHDGIRGSGPGRGM
jgi:HlyD family secretion protein